MKDLRQKWRSSVKGRVKRLRKSSQGRGIVHIREKDLVAVKGLAEKRGLKVEHAGAVVGGHIKVRLAGDDSGIDEIAKCFGKKMKQRMQTKGLGFDVVIACDNAGPILQEAQLCGISAEVVDGGVKLSGIDEKEVVNFIRRHRLMPESMVDQLIGGEIGGHKSMPSDKIKPAKARQILKDGTANGHPLTEKQRGMFGAAAGRKDMEDDESTDEKGIRSPSGKIQISNTTSGRVVHQPGSNPSSGMKISEPHPVVSRQIPHDQVGHSQIKPTARNRIGEKGIGDTARKVGGKIASAARKITGTSKKPTGATVGSKPPAVTGKWGQHYSGEQKAMPDEMPDESGMPTEPEATEAPPEEPFGAQVIRSIHQDLLAFMEKYDKVHPHIDHDPTRTHVEKLLERTEEDLTELEGLFESEERYKDLPELAGKVEEGEGDAEEAPIAPEDTEEAPEEVEGQPDTEEEADSGEEELPTPEESVEGMKSMKKSLPNQKRKSVAGNSDYPDRAEDQSKKGKRGLGIEGSHKPGFEEDSKGVAGDTDYPDEAQPQEELGTEDLGVEGEHKPGFEEHHKEGLQEATGFMKSLSETRDLEDEHRLEAHHHHRSLEGMVKHLATQFSEIDDQGGAAGVQMGGKGFMGAVAGGIAGFGSPIPGGAAGGAALGSAIQDRIAGKGKKGKGLKEGEKGVIGGLAGATLGGMVAGPIGAVAGGYLGHKVSEGKDMAETGRKIGSHIGGKIGAAAGGALERKLGKKGMEGEDEFPEMEEQDAVEGVQEGGQTEQTPEGIEQAPGGIKAWHKNLTESSGFLKQISKEHAYGDHHREKAGSLYKALEGTLSEAFPEMEEESHHSEVNEPMGEVCTKSLLNEAVIQNYELEKMLKQMNGLVSQLGV